MMGFKILRKKYIDKIRLEYDREKAELFGRKNKGASLVRSREDRGVLRDADRFLEVFALTQ